MKDYYKILGVAEEASKKEIRAHWIELTKRYHPDLAKTKEADRKIREINEAYEILGNDSTRIEYDFKRDLKRSAIKSAHSRKERRMHPRKIMLPLGILALFLIVGVIIFGWVHITLPLKSEVYDEGGRVSEEETAAQIPSAKIKPNVIEEKEVIPRGSKKIVLVSPQPPKKISPKSEVAVKAGEEVTLHLGPPPPLAKEEEVKQFFSNYIDRYNQKDIDGFLSFFSFKAIQNQKDELRGIRKIYSKFFGESRELRYQLEGMETEIYQNAVEVKARFRVDQVLRREEEKKVWTGTIRWVLGREDGVLKIVSVDYQNDKTPLSEKGEPEEKRKNEDD